MGALAGTNAIKLNSMWNGNSYMYPHAGDPIDGGSNLDVDTAQAKAAEARRVDEIKRCDGLMAANDKVMADSAAAAAKADVDVAAKMAAHWEKHVEDKKT